MKIKPDDDAALNRALALAKDALVFAEGNRGEAVQDMRDLQEEDSHYRAMMLAPFVAPDVNDAIEYLIDRAGHDVEVQKEIEQVRQHRSDRRLKASKPSTMTKEERRARNKAIKRLKAEAKRRGPIPSFNLDGKNEDE